MSITNAPQSLLALESHRAIDLQQDCDSFRLSSHIVTDLGDLSLKDVEGESAAGGKR